MPFGKGLACRWWLIWKLLRIQILANLLVQFVGAKNYTHDFDILYFTNSQLFDDFDFDILYFMNS